VLPRCQACPVPVALAGCEARRLPFLFSSSSKESSSRFLLFFLSLLWVCGNYGDTPEFTFFGLSIPLADVANSVLEGASP
jgi:hypothetical protein